MITIFTIPRPWVHQTLASMALGDAAFAKSQVELYVDAADTSHVEPLSHHFPISIRQSPAGDRALKPRQRIAMNMIRALRRHPTGELILAEDDIIVVDGWLTQFRRLAKQAEERSGPRFLLSGYMPFDWQSHTGSGMVSYPPAKFYGNQLLFIPETVRAEIADMLEARFDEKPSDILLADWGDAHGIPFWGASPSLAQHVGAVSLSGSVGHTSPVWLGAPA